MKIGDLVLYFDKQRFGVGGNRRPNSRLAKVIDTHPDGTASLRIAEHRNAGGPPYFGEDIVYRVAMRKPGSFENRTWQYRDSAPATSDTVDPMRKI